MGDEVLHILDTRLYEEWLAVGRVGVNGTDLGSYGASQGEEDIPFAPGLIQPQKEALIFLVVDNLIFGRRVAQEVAVQFVRSLGWVKCRVVEGAIVVAPLKPVIGILDAVWQQFAALQLFDPQCVGFGAIGIQREGKQGVIGADGKVAHVQEIMSLGLCVEIEQHLFSGVQTALLAAVNPVLLALFFAVIVEVAAVNHGDRFIGLFDAAPHLLVKRALQGRGVCQHRSSVAVLRFEICKHRGVVSLPQPVVGVDTLVAVILMGNRALLRHWRDRDRLLLADVCAVLHCFEISSLTLSVHETGRTDRLL